MEISRQFGTMESTPSMPLSFFKIRTISSPAFPGVRRVVELCDYMTIEIARQIDKGPYSNKLSKNMTPCNLMRFLLLLLIFTFMRFLGAAVKEGIPSDYDLELLSVKVEKWKKLGRRLKLEEPELTELHQENEELSEKVLAMLRKWRQKNAFEATYRCLYDALCHKLVNRKDLAKEFCCGCSKPEG